MIKLNNELKRLIELFGDYIIRDNIVKLLPEKDTVISFTYKIVNHKVVINSALKHSIQNVTTEDLLLSFQIWNALIGNYSIDEDKFIYPYLINIEDISNKGLERYDIDERYLYFSTGKDEYYQFFFDDLYHDVYDTLNICGDKFALESQNLAKKWDNILNLNRIRESGYMKGFTKYLDYNDFKELSSVSDILGIKLISRNHDYPVEPPNSDIVCLEYIIILDD